MFLDQMEREVVLDKVPRRVVSLVPSQTELLHYLGLDEEVAGITKFCVHPKEWHASKPKVGGTKDFKIDMIRNLEPDLIIANKEENNKGGIEILSKEFPVWVSDVRDFMSAIGMIRKIGLLLDREGEAKELVARINCAKTQFIVKKKKECVYLIWKNPYMTIGGDTYIHHMLELAGYDNIFKERTRYPEVTLEEIAASKADLIFLSSEPFPFREKHVAEVHHVTGKKVICVDGEPFSWYGSKLLECWDYFRILQAQTPQ